MMRWSRSLQHCITELLRHLHINVKENLMFVFTHARATFYRPVTSTPLIRRFLNDLKERSNVEVPFNQKNSFMLDNETFRYIAIHQQFREKPLDEKELFSESLKRSVQEYYRLVERILQCGIHRVKDTISLNDARNLIHRLARPIAETARLIEENTSLAQQYKTSILKTASERVIGSMPQKQGRFVALDKRLTVCITPTCTTVREIDGDFVVDYHTHCHDGCHLRNAVQECIGDPVLRHCAAMNPNGE